MTVPSVPLSSDSRPVSIPQLGYGVWKVPDAEVTDAVLTALEVGYRHIDTAKLYGNEAGVGRALAATDIPREDIFVTTKVWNDEQGYDEARAAFEASVQRLGGERLGPLDLFLIHWPAPRQNRYVETWRALQSLRDEGRVRAIGVCNFSAQQLRRLGEETGELPAINQIELNPLFPQSGLREFHAANGIVTQAWSPLAHGGELLRHPVLGALADKHGRTPAQVVIRWHLQLGNVVIPKSVTPSRIAENFDVLGFELDADDLSRITTLETGVRTGADPEVVS